MIVTFKKTRDGCVLAIERDDGTASINRSTQGGFFALHDLTHLVVETELGIADGFFGLLSRGWDVRTFEDKADPRYRELPRSAMVVEHMVGVLMRRVREVERADPLLRELWAAEINSEIKASLFSDGLAANPIPVAVLCAIGDRLESCGTAWEQLQIGNKLSFSILLDPSE